MTIIVFSPKLRCLIAGSPEGRTGTLVAHLDEHFQAPHFFLRHSTFDDQSACSSSHQVPSHRFPSCRQTSAALEASLPPSQFMTVGKKSTHKAPWCESIVRYLRKKIVIKLASPLRLGLVLVHNSCGEKESERVSSVNSGFLLKMPTTPCIISSGFEVLHRTR